MVFNDLDKLYEENGVAPSKRLALMEAHQGVINRDDVIAREINLDIVAGKADAAIQLLQSRFFRAWEGGGMFSLGDSWINANLVRGHQHMIARQYAQALADYQAALQIPANLQEATRDVSGRKGEVFYWIGNAYQAMGDSEKAQQFWRDASEASASQAAGGRNGEGGFGGLGGTGARGQFSGRSSMGGLAAGGHVDEAAIYYQAMALEKLGQNDRSRTMFQQLIDTGMKALSSVPDVEAPIPTNDSLGQRAQVADAHYLIGLGQLGLNNQDEARQEFALALKASPDHFAATMALADMRP